MPRLTNFPHQYNDLRKLRRTLEVHDDLRSRRIDTRDDHAFGYALARALIYRFRDTPGLTTVDYSAPEDVIAHAVDARIRQEEKKPPGDQGARTAAREMRKTMRYLGWVDDRGGLAPAGQELLATDPESDAEMRALRAALLDIEVSGHRGRSHPTRILLKLVDDTRLTSRSGMELALSADDDGPEAYAALLPLVALPEPDRRARLAATDFQMKNAVKILPSFALQTGMIEKGADGVYFLTPVGRAALADTAYASPVAVREPAARSGGADGGRSVPARPAPRRPATRRASAAELGRQYENASDRRSLTAEEQEAAARLLLERTSRHQEIVRQVGLLASGAELFEHEAAFDLLFVPPAPLPLVLWEIKTVDRDAVVQVRRAAEQIRYYERFYVRPHWRGREVLRAALLESPPGDELCAYLEEEHRIGALTLADGSLVPLNDTGTEVAAVVSRLDPGGPR